MAFGGLKSSVVRVAQATIGACVALSAFTALTSPAEAHVWRVHRHAVHYAYAPRVHYARAHFAPRAHVAARRYYAARAVAAPAVGPGFAAIVVDANSGRTLYASHDNELRHPASLTKVMTLYMLFEKLESGKMTLDTPIMVSEHAAAQAPTKLGLAPGQSIRVEDAIKAIVTRSANDMAVAVAEAIGGSEENFAQMMTQKAHALGMERTNYHNASGLPDDAQITTAHDLSILGRAVQDHFPRYFKYFSIQSFEYAGEVIGNHDHLLGRIDGVDGIKTGYTRASGFNLLTSLHRDGRSVVAVVMGGRSAASRDNIMAGLLQEHVAEASTGRSAPMIAENDVEPLPAVAAPAPRPAAPKVVVADARGEGDAEADIAESDAPAPRLAAVVRSPKIKTRYIAAPKAAPAVAKAPAAAPVVAKALVPAPVLAKAAAPVLAKPLAVAAAKTPAELGWVKGADAAPQGRAAAAKVQLASAAPAKEETAVALNQDHPAAHAGWIIQIGATDDAGKANVLLNRARAESRSALASARPYTEKVQKGDAAFYRARFAGLDSASAESACKSLKKAGFSCFPTQN